MSELLLKRWNNLLQLSADGDQPLPEQVVAALHPKLSFKKTTFVRHTHTNYAEQDSDFNVSPVQITEVSMYELIGGALVTGVGLLTKLVLALHGAGLTARFVDISPPRERPDCYVPDWDNLLLNMPTLRPKQIEALQRAVASEQRHFIGSFDAEPSFSLGTPPSERMPHAPKEADSCDELRWNALGSL